MQHLLFLLAFAALATARPSFIAVPADQIAFVDLSHIHNRHVRVPRQTLSPPPQLPAALYDQDYQPIPIQQYQQQYQQQPLGLAPPPEPQNQGRILTLQQQVQDTPTAAQETPRYSAQFAERPPDFGEYVDFGAHTGDHGAFGWYADYPINNHGDSGYRK